MINRKKKQGGFSMKWFVRGVALLITCSIYTLLRFSVFPYLGGAGSGLLTVALFGLGVWFIPTRIIRRMEAKKTAPPPPPSRKSHVRRETLYNFTVDGQSICIPESQFASFQAAQERIQPEQSAAPAPEPEPVPAAEHKPEPKRRPAITTSTVVYLSIIILLAIFSLLLIFSASSARNDLEEARQTIAELENEVSHTYDEGYEVGRSDGYDAAVEYIFPVADETIDSLLPLASEAFFFHHGACVVTSSGSGSRYHHYDCYHLGDGGYYIYNVELAESLGYTPCLDCWYDDRPLFPSSYTSEWDGISDYINGLYNPSSDKSKLQQAIEDARAGRSSSPSTP